MEEHDAPLEQIRDTLEEPAILLEDWFQRGIEKPLEHLVGGRARLKVIALLAMVLGLDAADKATVGAVAAPLELALHIGNFEIGVLVTASTAVGAIATLPFGILVDRVRRTRILIAAIVVWSVAMAVSTAATSYLMLLLCRLALGAIVAAASPTVASLIGDFFRPGERGRIYGYILAGELIGVAFGYLISGNVAALASWRAAFGVLAAIGFALAWVIWRYLPEPARGGQSQLPVGASEIPDAQDNDAKGTEAESPASDAPEDSEIGKRIEGRGIEPHAGQILKTDPSGMPLWQAVRYVLSLRTFRILIVASALGYFYFTGLRTFALVFVRGRFGLSQAVASTVVVGFGLGAIVGVLLAGRIADALIRRNRLDGRILVGVSTYLLAAAALIPGLLVGSIYVAAPFFFIAAAGLGGANPVVDAARLDIMHSRLWGRAEGVRSAVLYALQAIAPALFGWVSAFFAAGGGMVRAHARPGAAHPTGLGVTFLIMLVPLILAGVVMLRALKTYPRDVATAIASERATRRSAGRTA